MFILHQSDITGVDVDLCVRASLQLRERSTVIVDLVTVVSISGDERSRNCKAEQEGQNLFKHGTIHSFCAQLNVIADVNVLSCGCDEYKVKVSVLQGK